MGAARQHSAINPCPTLRHGRPRRRLGSVAPCTRNTYHSLCLPLRRAGCQPTLWQLAPPLVAPIPPRPPARWAATPYHGASAGAARSAIRGAAVAPRLPRSCARRPPLPRGLYARLPPPRRKATGRYVHAGRVNAPPGGRSGQRRPALTPLENRSHTMSIHQACRVPLNPPPTPAHATSRHLTPPRWGCPRPRWRRAWPAAWPRYPACAAWPPTRPPRRRRSPPSSPPPPSPSPRCGREGAARHRRHRRRRDRRRRAGQGR